MSERSALEHKHTQQTEMRTWTKGTALFVVAALVVVGCEAVVLHVGGNSRECFREDVPQGQNVKVLFQVLNGGDLSLDFEIDDPEGGRVHFAETRSDGRMDFRAAKSGFYRFCFDNHHSSADKELSVDIIVGESVDTGFAPNPDLLTPAEELVLTLSQGIQDVKYDQEYMYLRDVAHQNSLFCCFFTFIPLLVFFHTLFVNVSQLQPTPTGG